jgi:acyl dehydratase
MSHERTRIHGPRGLEDLVGKDLGASPWHVLAYDDIARFADATGDHQWIHVDRERIAKESPFGKPIAHGYFSVARIGGLFRQVVDPVGFALIVNYGLNKVRFPSPLREGDRYRLAMKLHAVAPIEKAIQAEFVGTIEIEGAPKPACVAEILYRFYPEGA